MLAEAETDLKTIRGDVRRLRWRLLEWVKDEAEAFWKGRRRDSLVGAARKQGSNVNALEPILILPPIRATSCIQVATQFSWRWAALPLPPFSMLVQLLQLLCNISTAGAYRVCVFRHGPHAKPIWISGCRCLPSRVAPTYGNAHQSSPEAPEAERNLDIDTVHSLVQAQLLKTMLPASRANQISF